MLTQEHVMAAPGAPHFAAASTPNCHNDKPAALYQVGPIKNTRQFTSEDSDGTYMDSRVFKFGILGSSPHEPESQAQASAAVPNAHNPTLLCDEDDLDSWQYMDQCMEMLDLRNLRIKQIASGNHSMMLLLHDGTVLGMGKNETGLLGCGANGGALGFHARPVSPKWNNNNVAPRIVKIACGEYHSMMLSEDGRLFGCGTNEYGELGTSNSNDQNTVKIPRIQHQFNRECKIHAQPVVVECVEKIRLGLEEEGDNDRQQSVNLISCSEFQTIITTNTNRTYAFGQCFGSGAATTSEAEEIEGLRGLEVTSMGCNGFGGVFCLSDGRVFVVEFEALQKKFLLREVEYFSTRPARSVATSSLFFVALLKEDPKAEAQFQPQLVSIGDNNYIGHIERTVELNYDQQIFGTVRCFCVGEEQLVVLTSLGILLTTGRNYWNQLGHDCNFMQQYFTNAPHLYLERENWLVRELHPVASISTNQMVHHHLDIRQISAGENFTIISTSDPEKTRRPIDAFPALNSLRLKLAYADVALLCLS